MSNLVPNQSTGADFGGYNTANTALPFVGEEGGPATIEGWAQMATFTIRSLQAMANGMFGGPSFMATNTATRENNLSGKPLTGSTTGTHYYGPGAVIVWPDRLLT